MKGSHRGFIKVFILLIEFQLMRINIVVIIVFLFEESTLELAVKRDVSDPIAIPINDKNTYYPKKSTSCLLND